MTSGRGVRRRERPRRMASTYDLGGEAQLRQRPSAISVGLRGCRIASLCGAIVFAATLMFLLTSGGLAITSVESSGNKRVAASDIDRLVAAKGQNSLLVDGAAIKSRLQTLPYIRSSEVWVTLPGTISVRIDERTPFLGFHCGKDYVLVDREGVVLEKTQSPEGTVEVSLVGGDSPDVGSKIPTDLVLALGRLTDDLGQKCGVTVTSVEYSQLKGIRVFLTTGQSIAFGGPEEMDQKLAIVQAFLSTRRDWSELNVTSTQRPFYRRNSQS
ncbi:MAG: FtsQ-type POTRA domain-containing protein [Chloroflexi bacterium]|nr:FtsQ-type POTRA domain-containing protein [Chloroflexota bacterium]